MAARKITTRGRTGPSSARKNLPKGRGEGAPKVTRNGKPSAPTGKAPASVRVPKAATPFTDLGNAERLARDHGVDLRYCGQLGGWYRWAGTHWERDVTGEAERRAHATARALYLEIAELVQVVATLPEGDRRNRCEARLKGLWRHQKESEDAKRLGPMLDEARAIRPIPVEVDAFDHDGYLLNTESGTLDLRTCKVRGHRREDLITKVAPVAWEARAEAPLFHAFLERVLPDPEKRAFVLRWAGYAATGVIREHFLVFWYGEGANGKSTLAEILRAVLGPYCVAMPERFLAERKHAEHATEIARLRGARLAIATETQDGCALDEARIKRLTGGDTLTGRFMRKDYFDFDPTAKFVLLTNHRPPLRGSDEGIRRRVLLVYFDVVIPEADRDPKLREKILEHERAGVLRWAVDGARAWHARGERLEPPPAVVAATADYLAGADIMGRFLADCCELRPPDERPARVRTAPADLHAALVKWGKENDESVGSSRWLAIHLGKRGYVAEKSNGARAYPGIGLLSPVAASGPSLAAELLRDARVTTPGNRQDAHTPEESSGNDDPRVPAGDEGGDS